jgi:hypothetical protein
MLFHQASLLFMLNILGEVVSPDVVHPVIRQRVAMGSLASKKIA